MPCKEAASCLRSTSARSTLALGPLGPSLGVHIHASVVQEMVRCVGDEGFGVDGRWDNDWGILGECPREPVQSDGGVGWG